MNSKTFLLWQFALILGTILGLVMATVWAVPALYALTGLLLIRALLDWTNPVRLLPTVRWKPRWVFLALTGSITAILTLPITPLLLWAPIGLHFWFSLQETNGWSRPHPRSKFLPNLQF